MVKFVAAVVPPTGPGFVTVTLAVPAEATSLAGIAAVICVALTNVVGSAFGAPPTEKFTTEVETNFVPFTVSVNAAPPGACDLPAAFTPVMVGAGLFTVNATAFDAPPPGTGFVTVTFGVPPVAISAEGIVTVMVVDVIKEGVSAGLEPNVTVAPATKPVPLIVNANAAPPALVLAGESGGVMTGTGLLLVSEKFAEVAPAALATTL